MASFERDTAIRGIGPDSSLTARDKQTTAATAAAEEFTDTAAVKTDDELVFPVTPITARNPTASTETATAIVDTTTTHQPNGTLTNGTSHASPVDSEDVAIDIDNEVQPLTTATHSPNDITLPDLQQPKPTVNYYPSRIGGNTAHPESDTFTPIVQKPPSWNIVGILLLLLCLPFLLILAVAMVFLSRLIVADELGQLPEQAQFQPSATNLPTGARFIHSTHGYWLFRQIHQQGIDTNPRAYLVLTHGLGEYTERAGYLKLVKEMNKRNIIVVCWHQQGHGRSTGERGYVQRLQQSVDDLATVMADAERAMKKSGIHADVLPRFVYGHSMGALVTLMSLCQADRYKIHINGAIISSPPVLTDNDLAPAHMRAAAKMLSMLTPKTGVEDFPLAELSRNEQAIEAYKHDDLIYHGKLRARIGSEILKQQDLVSTNVHRSSVPILLLHGTSDKICPPASSQLIYDRIATPDKHLVWFGAGKHELQEDMEWSDLYVRAATEFTQAPHRYFGNERNNTALAWQERVARGDERKPGRFLWK